MKILLKTLVVLFFCNVANSQIIYVLDTDSNSIPDCNVIVESSNIKVYKFTDNDGKVNINNILLKGTKNFKLNVSNVGYETKKVNYKNGKKTYYVILQKKDLLLEDLVITAQIEPKKISNAIHNIKSISKKEINEIGAVSLTDIISKYSGFRITNDNILGQSSSIQGISGQNIKIMIDDIAVIGRLNGNIDLSQINLNNVERIEIVEGPLSVEYGTDALAGTINLITKSTENNFIKISSLYETVGRYNLNVSSGLKKGKINLVTDFGRNYFDGWTDGEDFNIIPKKNLADSSRYKKWKPKEQYFITVKNSFKNNKIYSELRLASFYETILNRGYPRPPYFENAFDDFYKTYRNNISIKLNKNEESNSLSFLSSFNHYKRRKNTYFNDLTTLNKTLTETSGDQDTIVFTKFDNRISFQSNFKNIFNYKLGLNISTETSEGERISGKEKNISEFALFSFLEYKMKNLHFRPAIRFAYNTSYTAPLIPSFNLMYKKNDLTFRSSVAKGFRSPSLKELYFNFVDINHNIVGNKNLKAENSVNFSSSLQLSISDVLKGIKVKAFYNDVNDLIVLAENNGQYTYENVEEYSTLGASINSQVNFNQFKLYLEYSKTGKEFTSISKNLKFFDEFSTSLSRNYMNYNILLNLKYNGKYTFLSTDENNYVKENTANSYTMLDFSINRKFNNIFILFGIKNILNTKDIEFSGVSSGVHQSSSSSISTSYGTSFFIKIDYSL